MEEDEIEEGEIRENLNPEDLENSIDYDKMDALDILYCKIGKS